jgi:hypothetical protein
MEGKKELSEKARKAGLTHLSNESNAQNLLIEFGRRIREAFQNFREKHSRKGR